MSFAVAILWICFYQTNLATQVAVSVTVFITVICVGAVVYSGIDSPSTIDAPSKRESSTRCLNLKAKTARVRLLVKKMHTMPRGAGRKIRTLSTQVATSLKPPRRVLHPVGQDPMAHAPPRPRS